MKYEWVNKCTKMFSLTRNRSLYMDKNKPKLIFPHQKDDYSRHGGWEEKQALVRGAVYAQGHH